MIPQTVELPTSENALPSQWQRPDGRAWDQLRPVSFLRHFTEFPTGSVLAKFGNTQLICTVSIEQGVPKFLQDSGQGWLTAEYRFLPGATKPRQPRELLKLSGRTQEIQRLIGRSLRSALNLKLLPNFTIAVDVDVLQADAGTRTGGVTAGFVALQLAVERLMAEGGLTHSPIERAIAAISVGLINGEPFLDLDYIEDVAASVDLNVVMDDRLNLIEIQGTAESETYSRHQLNQMLDLAETGIKELQAAQQSQTAS
jgi:ribonuclease PH